MSETKITALEILTEARKLIAGGWCQGSYCKDKGGRLVSYGDPQATQFCALGAMYHYIAFKDPTNAVQGCEATAHAIHLLQYRGTSLARFNDRDKTTQADVLMLFDEAIYAAEVEVMI